MTVKTVARQLALGFIALAIAGLAVWYWLNRKVEPVFLLELPVACEMGTACMVQHYVDQTPGPDAGDYTCGPLTYDGHKGIDIRVAGLPEMRAGVEVLAAAAGVVRAVRDGMADVSVNEIGEAALMGNDAGNAVVIVHEDGWESQYSHLREDSVAVKKGQRVETGETLGLIGLSGNSEFPHVEFSLRHEGQTIDPFTGLPKDSGCQADGLPLWSETAQAALSYQAGGLLLAGFAADIPTLKGIIEGGERGGALAPDSTALVFWAASWGLRKDDSETIRILRPNGEVFAQSSEAVPKNKAQWLRFIGRKRKAEPWPAGSYHGEYRVTRDIDGQPVTIVETSREIEIR